MIALYRVADMPHPWTTGGIRAAFHGGSARTVEATGMTRNAVQTPWEV